MPPQIDQNSNQSEQADFGFMLNQQPQQAQTGPVGKFSKLGKPVKLLIAAVVILIVVTVAAMILGGGENNSARVLDLMAQNQEIVRVSQAQDQKFGDANTKGLSATAQAAMNSQKFQLGDYLTKTNVKYNPQQLAGRTNSNTDKELQTATQNNNLDEAYISYLKTSLAAYLNSLDTTSKTTKSQTLKATLQSAASSVQTLLNSPQFKS